MFSPCMAVLAGTVVYNASTARSNALNPLLMIPTVRAKIQKFILGHSNLATTTSRIVMGVAGDVDARADLGRMLRLLRA